MSQLRVLNVVSYSLVSVYILSLLLFMNNRSSTTIFEWRLQLNGFGPYVDNTLNKVVSDISKQDNTEVVTTIQKSFTNKQVAHSLLENVISTEGRTKTGYDNDRLSLPSKMSNKSEE